MSSAVKDQYFLWQFSPEDEAKIRYQEFGTDHPEKTPLLFIHGYGGMLEHWNLNIPAFAHEHKIYALDLVGFGKSQKPNVRYSLELFASQIEAFLYLKKLDKVIIIGHSMGAASGILFAHHKPEKVKALILANPSGLFGDTMEGMTSFFFGIIGSPLIGEVLFTAFANQMGVSQSLIPTYFNQQKVDAKLINQFTLPLQDKEPNGRTSLLRKDLLISGSISSRNHAITPGRHILSGVQRIQHSLHIKSYLNFSSFCHRQVPLSFRKQHTAYTTMRMKRLTNG